MSFFCFSIACRLPHHICCYYSFFPPPIYNSFSVSLSLMALTLLTSTSQLFHRNVPQLVFLWCFLMIRMRLYIRTIHSKAVCPPGRVTARGVIFLHLLLVALTMTTCLSCVYQISPLESYCLLGNLS